MREEVLAFGAFELLPAQRRLLRSGEPVRLGSRALDILLALVARAGEVVSKEELIASVWPDTFVEDNNLRVHVTSLRKALGDDRAAARYIVNVPGRGYSFVGALERPAPAVPEPRPAPPRRPVGALPTSLGRMIGRDELVEELSGQVPERRLLTITGTGGLGKTTVALAVARRLRPACRDGVAYLDLAPVSDPRFLPTLLASALGQAVRSDDAPVDAVAALLRDRHMLVVLDGCEHMVEACARLAEALLSRAPDVSILATSREPLRAEGEWVHLLASLDLPPAEGPSGAEDALRSSAVQLFVSSASARLGGYRLSDADAPFVAEICRRMDGIALAIELAAARAGTIGVEALAGSLDDVFRVLTRGRRTALPRHQTLRATLDWSHRLLPPREQLLLRRLAVFNGFFGLDAARAVTAGGGLSGRDIDDNLASLVAKSLVSADGGRDLRFRLLDTTRAYAREKLAEGGEGDLLARRHAEHCRALFERAEAEWESRPSTEWVADYERHLGDLRAALAWAFSPAGDPSAGAALTAAAVPLWFQLSLVGECLEQVQRALTWSQQSAPGDKRRRMQLHAALGFPQMRAVAGFPSGAEAWQATLALAEELGDTDYQLRALWALWVDRTNSGEPRAALALAGRFADAAESAGASTDLCLADRMRARSLHFLGDQDGALRHVRRMLDRYVAPSNRSYTARFQYDQAITARITLARALWVAGFADQALAETARSIDDALSLGHVLTLAHVLSDGACPVALHAGDLALADRYTALLHRHTRDHALDVWHTYADSFRAQLLIRTGHPRTGLAMLRDAIDKLSGSGFVLFRVPFLGALAVGEGGGEGWAEAELWRLRGEILLAVDGMGVAETAGDLFRRAMGIARQQKALSWELRAATSAARLLLLRDRAQEAADLLASVRGRLEEGFGTADVLAADAVLAEARAQATP